MPYAIIKHLASGSRTAAEQASEAAVTDRFQFGENCSRFLRLLDEERIRQARVSLCEMLSNSLAGLFSLAARRLGAERVHHIGAIWKAHMESLVRHGGTLFAIYNDQRKASRAGQNQGALQSIIEASTIVTFIVVATSFVEPRQHALLRIFPDLV